MILALSALLLMEQVIRPQPGGGPFRSFARRMPMARSRRPGAPGRSRSCKKGAYTAQPWFQAIDL